MFDEKGLAAKVNFETQVFHTGLLKENKVVAHEQFVTLLNSVTFWAQSAGPFVYVSPRLNIGGWMMEQ